MFNIRDISQINYGIIQNRLKWSMMSDVMLTDLMQNFAPSIIIHSTMCKLAVYFKRIPSYFA